MIPNLPSVKEQIEAIVNHKACELVEKYIVQHSKDASYEGIFTIKKSDILNYLSKFPLEKFVQTRSASSDGFYVIRDNESYFTYEQYDGVAMEKKTVLTEHEVIILFVDYLIRTSGTGLNFD